MTLMEKLILLGAVKFATLDAYGMGIEMEGGKPGWYDALNGMPGLFGSSMAETYELARMLSYTIEALKQYPGEVALIEELGCFLDELNLITRLEHDNIMRDEELLSFWNRINDAKEIYRDKTYQGVSGKKMVYHTEQLAAILEGFLEIVTCGIKKARRISGEICPTYFTYEVPEYEKLKDGGIRPLKFVPQNMPYFLEGPVRYLKLPVEQGEKRALYEAVKESDLYDGQLSMYKVNASLADSSFELGRARAFTPGWLENESIWLHMEYKYLLELLRSGLYEEFFADFKKAAIPFQNPEIYGRSIYENSSFIASSRNPNPSCRGRGFVARLSGSTIEFISMWKEMMFGAHPFRTEQEELVFSLAPAIPAYLIPEDGRLSAAFMSKTTVCYEFGGHRDYVPGTYRIRHMVFFYENGSQATVEGEKVSGKLAEDIRAGRVRKMEVAVD